MSNQRFIIDVHGLKNFSEKEKNKFSAAMIELEKCLNNMNFKNAILLHEFDDQTNGRSNKELYDHFMSGRDKFNKLNDRDIDLNLTLYYSWKSTVGYTYPSTWFTWLNRKFFSRFNYGEISGNVVHENRHNAGYGHESASDHDSVPYAFGYIARDLINGKIPPIQYTKRKIKVKYKRSFWSRFKGLFYVQGLV